MNTFFSSSQRGKKRRPQGPTHTAPARPKERSNPSTSDSGGMTATLKAALFALPFGLAIGFILLLVLAAVALAAPDPDAMIPPLALAALGVTFLLGGLIAARKNPASPMIRSLLCGLLLTLLLWTVSCLLPSPNTASHTASLITSTPARMAVRAASLALSAAGGLMGRRR